MRRLVDYEAFCSVPEAGAPGDDPAAITPRQLAELLALRSAGGADFDLIDVREPGEFDIVHVEGSRLVPLGRVLSGEFLPDPARGLILLCRTDVRSRQAMDALVAAGHEDVRYVRGGVVAWVTDIEPDKPTY